MYHNSDYLFTDENMRYVQQLESYIDRFLLPGYRPASYEFGIARRAVKAVELYRDAQDMSWKARPLRDGRSTESDCYRKAYVAIRTTYAQLRSKSLI